VVERHCTFLFAVIDVPVFHVTPTAKAIIRCELQICDVNYIKRNIISVADISRLRIPEFNRHKHAMRLRAIKIEVRYAVHRALARVFPQRNVISRRIFEHPRISHDFFPTEASGGVPKRARNTDGQMKMESSIRRSGWHRGGEEQHGRDIVFFLSSCRRALFYRILSLLSSLRAESERHFRRRSHKLQ